MGSNCGRRRDIFDLQKCALPCKRNGDTFKIFKAIEVQNWRCWGTTEKFKTITNKRRGLRSAKKKFANFRSRSDALQMTTLNGTGMETNEWWFLFLLIWLDVRTASAAKASATLPPCKTFLTREKLLTLASASFRERMLTKICPRTYRMYIWHILFSWSRILKKKQSCGDMYEICSSRASAALPRASASLRQKTPLLFPDMSAYSALQNPKQGTHPRCQTIETITSSDIFVLWFDK